MGGLRQGAFRLFRFRGIDVFLHWSWFLVAVFEINARSGRYSSVLWNVLEYLALFLIVTCHEFGHALACRQVGGRANHIVLWPLGGVAFVDPPPRPGATLWSLAAGPLVNVVLIPVFYVVGFVGGASGVASAFPDFRAFLIAASTINLGLLAFNLLPIYPLDGGQILRSLLWYVMGRARSLLVVTVLGFAGVALFVAFAVWQGSVWFFLLAAFVLLNCWGGLRQALALSRMAKAPRRQGFACPACGAAPPLGEFWLCGGCRHTFDTFATQATCPNCGARFPTTTCGECGKTNPISRWATTAPPVIEGSVVDTVPR